MSGHKRTFLIAALAVAASVGITSRADAQYRRGRAVVVVGGGFYSPLWAYDPWWGDPFYQWGPYPYPYPYPFRYRDPGASVRLEVKPKEAEVYVDGYFAGIVDDFDGVFQRLHVPPGEHEITLYLDGYRTATQRVYLTPDNTFKIKYTLERLPAGEQPQPRPQPAAPPPGMQPPYPPGPPQGAPYPPNGPQTQPPIRRGAPRPMPPNAPPPDMPPPGARANAEGYGTIAIRVQPADAEVLIDNQVWRGPSDQNGVSVEVAEGRHAIEIRKAGYRSYVTEVDVRRGETTPLNVSLRGQNE